MCNFPGANRRAALVSSSHIADRCPHCAEELPVVVLCRILIFRHYVTAAHRKLDEIVKLLGDTGGSPVPVRFTLWMTHLMAAGFVVSYFAWFSLLLLPRD